MSKIFTADVKIGSIQQQLIPIYAGDEKLHQATGIDPLQTLQSDNPASNIVIDYGAVETQNNVETPVVESKNAEESQTAPVSSSSFFQSTPSMELAEDSQNIPNPLQNT